MVHENKVELGRPSLSAQEKFYDALEVRIKVVHGFACVPPPLKQ